MSVSRVPGVYNPGKVLDHPPPCPTGPSSAILLRQADTISVVVRAENQTSGLIFHLMPDHGGDVTVEVARRSYKAAIRQVASLILMGCMTNQWTFGSAKPRNHER